MCKKKYQADAKKKAKANIIDEKAINIIRSILPEYWTIRDYKPDYGIDLAIETFDDNTLETLGEHFFVQVKGQEKVKKGIKKIKSKNCTYSLDVIKFSLETDLLFTVQRMGHGCPVMLFVVDVINLTIYFVNLNDYIDKVFIAQNINFTNQKKITIDIPIENVITKEKGFEKLFFYAKRAKFYSLFETVSAQFSNLQYISSFSDYLNQVKKYAGILLKYDILNSKNSKHYFFSEIEKLDDILNDYKIFISKNLDLDNEKKEWCIGDFSGEHTLLDSHKFMYVQSIWKDLNYIQEMHEDCWRKLYLPTEYYCIVKD